jgi:hypothetical protein
LYPIIENLKREILINILEAMANYKEGGYEKKYIISKANGNPTDPNADYFLLRLDKDPCAIIALIAYANTVRRYNKPFADDLDKKIEDYARGDGNKSSEEKVLPLNIVSVSDCPACSNKPTQLDFTNKMAYCGCGNSYFY